MKPRFSKCTGPTPAFLIDLECAPEKNSLVFSNCDEDKELHFLDAPDFLEALAFVLNSKVPIAIGRMDIGASEMIGYFSLEGKIANKYVSVFLFGGGAWEIGEPDYKSHIWEPCEDPYEISNKAFYLDSLKRAH